MKNLGLIKNFIAGGVINPFRILKLSADDAVVQAAAASDALIGIAVVPYPGSTVALNERIDVCLSGACEVEYGGGVTRGALLTADANGKAVTASAADRVIGVAMVSGVSGDIGSVMLGVTGRVNADSVYVADLHITSAQLLALNATPKQIIAAPGANKFIAVEDITMYHAGGTAYDGIAGGEDLAVAFTNLSGPVIGTVETTGFLDQASAQTRYLRPGDVRTTLAGTPTVNAPVVVGLLTGEIATGDFDLYVRATYKIMDAVLA